MQPAFSTVPRTGDMTGWRGRARVAAGARELSLQGRERLDQLGGLESAMAPADADLPEHAGSHEPVHGLARGLKRSVDQRGRGRRGEHGRGGQLLDEQARCRIAARVAGPLDRPAGRPRLPGAAARSRPSRGCSCCRRSSSARNGFGLRAPPGGFPRGGGRGLPGWCPGRWSRRARRHPIPKSWRRCCRAPPSPLRHGDLRRAVARHRHGATGGLPRRGLRYERRRPTRRGAAGGQRHRAPRANAAARDSQRHRPPGGFDEGKGIQKECGRRPSGD